ncbi:uncharacterized protein METZ01_LOCUS222959, partial [marine metagenome]
VPVYEITNVLILFVMRMKDTVAIGYVVSCL